MKRLCKNFLYMWSICNHDDPWARIKACFYALTHGLFLSCTEGIFSFLIEHAHTHILECLNVHELFRWEKTPYLEWPFFENGCESLSSLVPCLESTAPFQTPLPHCTLPHYTLPNFPFSLQYSITMHIEDINMPESSSVRLLCRDDTHSRMIRISARFGRTKAGL